MCVVILYFQDTGPPVSKSRTQKFHKLFKTVPENEFPVDCKYHMLPLNTIDS